MSAIKYRVKITCEATGESVVADMGKLHWEDSDLFWWTDGNGGCDCNRFLIFDRVKRNDPYFDDEETETVCGHSKYKVHYAEFDNGRRILIDDDPAIGTKREQWAKSYQDAEDEPVDINDIKE